MARVELRESQVRILMHRSGGICCYPSCGAALDVSHALRDDQPKNIGKIAHICAASERGPRFDRSMTDAERSSVDNLMYLCGPCHDRIDAQTAFHTVEWLRQRKSEHEEAVRRSVRYSVQDVGFEQLEAVCSFLAVATTAQSLDSSIGLPLGIEDKLVLNGLRDATRDKVRDGLAQSRRVGDFIRLANDSEPRYGRRLTAKVQTFYSGGVADGLEGDDLFDFVCALTLDRAGARMSDVLEAAAVAVVTHIFTQCEIFDHVSTAA